MSHCYIATAHGPSSVTCSSTCRLSNTNDIYLVVSKANKIEIFVVTAEGLKSVHEFTVFGRIVQLKTYRPPNHNVDYIVFFTAKLHVAVLQYHPNEDTLKTVAYGNLEDPCARFNETVSNMIINDSGTIGVVSVYQGHIKVLKMALEGGVDLIKSIKVRVDEHEIIDLCFLKGTTHTLVFMYMNSFGRHVITYKLTPDLMRLEAGPWRYDNIDEDFFIMSPVPKPYGGVILLGCSTVSHLAEKQHTFSPPILKNVAISCITFLEKSILPTFLVGDQLGRLYSLIVSSIDDEIKLSMAYHGSTSLANSISYLDNNIVYIGSLYGDSQLISIPKDSSMNSDVDDQNLKVISSFCNIGPIIDMDAVDPRKNGSCELVACSGVHKNGSLRILHSGASVSVLSTFDLPNIKNIFSIAINRETLINDSHDSLVLSFSHFSKFVIIDGHDLIAKNPKWFVSDEPTLFAGNVAFEQFIQVSTQGILLMSLPRDFSLIDSCTVSYLWKPTDNDASQSDLMLGHVSVHASKTIFVSARNMIYVLSIDNGTIHEVCRRKMSLEVSSLDFTVVHDPVTMSNKEIFTVTLWNDSSLQIFATKRLELICSTQLGEESLPRSVMVVQFTPNLTYVLLGMANGSLICFNLNLKVISLSEPRTIHLGTTPLELKPLCLKTNSRDTFENSFVNPDSLSNNDFVSNSQPSRMNILCCCDRPAIIYHNSYRILFTFVNHDMIKSFCYIRTENFNHNVCLITRNQLCIASINQVHRNHVTSIPLCESPKRIAYQEQTHIFGLVTSRLVDQVSEMDVEKLPLCEQPVSFRCKNFQERTRSSDSSAMRNEMSQSVDFNSLVEERYSFVILSSTTFEPLNCYTFAQYEYVSSLISCSLGINNIPYFVVGTSIAYPNQSDSKEGSVIVFRFLPNEQRLVVVAEQTLKGGVNSICVHKGRIFVSVHNAIQMYELKAERALSMVSQHSHGLLSLYLKQNENFILSGDFLLTVSMLRLRPDESIELVCHDYRSSLVTAIELVDDNHCLTTDIHENLYISVRGHQQKSIPGHVPALASCKTESESLKMDGFFYLGDYVSVMKEGFVAKESINPSSEFVRKGTLFGCKSGMVGSILHIDPSIFAILFLLQQEITDVLQSVGNINHSEYRAEAGGTRRPTSCKIIDGDLVENYLNLPVSEMSRLAENIKTKHEDPSKITVEYLVYILSELSRLH